MKNGFLHFHCGGLALIANGSAGSCAEDVHGPDVCSQPTFSAGGREPGSSRPDQEVDHARSGGAGQSCRNL